MLTNRCENDLTEGIPILIPQKSSSERHRDTSRKTQQRYTQTNKSSVTQHPVLKNPQTRNPAPTPSSESTLKLNSNADPFYPSSYKGDFVHQNPSYPAGNFQQPPPFPGAPAWNYAYPYVAPTQPMKYMQPLSTTPQYIEYQNVVNFPPIYGIPPPVVVPSPGNPPAETQFENSQPQMKLPPQNETHTATKSSGKSNDSSSDSTSSSSSSSESSYDGSFSADSDSRGSAQNRRRKNTLKLQNQNFFKPVRGSRGSQGHQSLNFETLNRSSPKKQRNASQEKAESNPKPRSFNAKGFGNDRRDRNSNAKRSNNEGNRGVEGIQKAQSDEFRRKKPQKRRTRKEGEDQRVRREQGIEKLPEYRETEEDSSFNQQEADGNASQVKESPSRAESSDRLAPVMDELVAWSVCWNKEFTTTYTMWLPSKHVACSPSSDR